MLYSLPGLAGCNFGYAANLLIPFMGEGSRERAGVADSGSVNDNSSLYLFPQAGEGRNNCRLQAFSIRRGEKVHDSHSCAVYDSLSLLYQCF